MTGGNNDVVNKLADDFNASQSEYKVVPSFKGSYADAVAEYSKLSKIPTPAEDQLVSGGLGYVYAVSGKRREALDILAQFSKLSKSRYVDACMVAAIYAGLGDKDRALDN